MGERRQGSRELGANENRKERTLFMFAERVYVCVCVCVC